MPGSFEELSKPDADGAGDLATTQRYADVDADDLRGAIALLRRVWPSYRTASNFGRTGVTDYRNPHIAEAMKVLGFVQKFGVGIATARKSLLSNGNPPPEFTVEDNAVLATVRIRK